jgi:hypothetical protein
MPEAPANVAPAAPIITVDSIGVSSASLSWTVSEAVDKFELQATILGTPFVSIEGASSLTGTERSVEITGLNEGTLYRFRIRAVREGLASSWTLSALATTLEPATVAPVAPVAPSIAVDAVGIGTVDLSWSVSDAVDGFELQMSEGGAEFADVELLDPLAGGETGLQLVGLGEAVDYRFQIRAVKDGLYSEWAQSQLVTTLEPALQAPSAPSLQAQLLGFDSIRLSWSAAETVDGFEIQVSEAGSAYEDVSSGVVYSASETEVLIEGLANTETYQFRIRAVRAGLYSSWIESDPITTAKAPWPLAEHNWKFNSGVDSIAYDSGAKALDLNLGSHPGIGWGDGVGEAHTGIDFSGSHKGIEIPDSAAINLTDQKALTISLWVKVAGNPEKATSVIYEQGGFWRGLNLVVDEGWLLASGWNRPVKESDWAGTTLQGGQLPVNQWSHIVLVLDAEETIRENGLTLYVNGNPVASGPASMIWANMEKTGLGQIQGGTVYRDREVRRLDPFEGAMDNVNVWCCALSGAEIKALYDSASSN